MALGLLLVAGLRRVVVAQHHLFTALRFLVVHPAAEGLGVLGGDHALALQVELHFFHGGDEADRHVAHPRGVVAKVEAERAVAVVHDLPHDQQVEFDGFDVGVEVAPAEHPGQSNLHDGLQLRPRRVSGELRGAAKDFPQSLLGRRVLSHAPGLKSPDLLRTLLVFVGLW